MTGYVFQFQDKQFDPSGQVTVAANDQIESMKRGEPQILYWFSNGERIGTSDGSHKFNVTRLKESHHNFGGVRTDYWFTAFGHTWHGVNIGDNDIVRCKRNKK